jgi:7-carboxy-7-deazaguanine synthase
MDTVNELLDKGLKLPVMEAFYTIQGEGANSGSAAYFVRLGGCDVGCHWCDVKESWDKNAHPLKSIEEILENAKAFKGKNIVITGGEPAMYQLIPLTELLKSQGYKLWIETSGAYEITGDWDWICLSPKRSKLPKNEELLKANELKVVVYNNDDFNFALKYKSMVSANCELYLQPEWSKQEKMLPKIIDFVKENPEWKISLQTHKFMNIP